MNLSPTLHLAHKDFKNWRSNLLPTGLNLKWVDWTCSVSDLFGSFKMILPPLQPKNPLGQERVFLTNPTLQKRLESALKWLKTGHKIIYGLQTGEASAKYAEASQVCRAGRVRSGRLQTGRVRSSRLQTGRVRFCNKLEFELRPRVLSTAFKSDQGGRPRLRLSHRRQRDWSPNPIGVEQRRRVSKEISG